MTERQAGTVISVRSRGRFANRMIQYMVARALARRLPGAAITGVALPDWGIATPDNPDPAAFDTVLHVGHGDPLSLDLADAAAAARAGRSCNIVIDDYVQRIALFDPAERYRAVFPPAAPAHAIGADELLIHIRGDEVLAGAELYPLLPIGFYRWIVAHTGLAPAFCGQLAPGPYIDALRAAFPRARFIDSLGALADFQLARAARFVLPSVSTFCWLAAWLSDATTVFLPLAGFLNPAHARGIVDLVPAEDTRYRFVLFPLMFGLPQTRMMAQHERLDGRWKEISPAQVALLKHAAPLLAPRAARVDVDPVWYAHRYVDAAMEISEGWCADPLQHYLEIGRRRGYLPVAPPVAPAPLAGRAPARGRPAMQSSVSEWSHGATPAADAAVAVDGDALKRHCCHTAIEDRPWWRVDLGALVPVAAIRLFNRDAPPAIQQRTAPLLVEGSADGDAWFVLFETGIAEYFGGRDGRPLLWQPPAPVPTRHVRITIPRHECLHLAAVEVYG